MLLLGEQDFAATGHDSFDANAIVMVTLRQSASEAELAGAGLGTLIVIAVLGAVWFFPTMGAAMIGFMVKKNTIVEIGPTGSLVGQASTASAAGGWAGVIGFAVLGLIAMGISSIPKHERPTRTINSSTNESITPSTSESITPSTSDEWELTESTDRMDSTPVVILEKRGSGGATITIRCSKGKTQAYIDTNKILDTGNVRIKFDESR